MIIYKTQLCLEDNKVKIWCSVKTDRTEQETNDTVNDIFPIKNMKKCLPLISFSLRFYRFLPSCTHPYTHEARSSVYKVSVETLETLFAITNLIPQSEGNIHYYHSRIDLFIFCFCSESRQRFADAAFNFNSAILNLLAMDTIRRRFS